MKEPFNIKLFVLFLVKNIQAVVFSLLLGAALFGTGYFLVNVVFAPGKDYVAESGLYLTYADEVRLENVYINDYTWQDLAASDVCVDEVLKELTFDISRDELLASISVKPESDVRFVVIKATTKDPAKSVAIANAYEHAVTAMAEKMVDLKEVQVFNSAKEAKPIVFENRLARMAATGAVVGFVLGLLFLFLKFVYDDSVSLPEQTYIRYGINTLLCVTKEGAAVSDWDKTAGKNNLQEVLGGKTKVVFTDISGEKGCEKEETAKRMADISEILPKDVTLHAADGLNQNADAIVQCKEADGVILLIRANAHNGKLIERALDYLRIQDVPIFGIILYDTPAKKMLRYFSTIKQ